VRAEYSEPETVDMNEGVLAPVRPVFRELARTIVPACGDLDDRGWTEVEAIVEDALGQRPASMRRQLLIFIRVLNLLPIPRWLRTFVRLGPDQRIRFLHAVQTSRVFPFRRGFWGLRTLVYMGYYARLEACEAVGYDARLRGWLEHPEADDAARRATRAGLSGDDGL
jgi:hypothetical protein